MEPAIVTLDPDREDKEILLPVVLADLMQSAPVSTTPFEDLLATYNQPWQPSQGTPQAILLQQFNDHADALNTIATEIRQAHEQHVANREWNEAPRQQMRNFNESALILATRARLHTIRGIEPAEGLLTLLRFDELTLHWRKRYELKIETLVRSEIGHQLQETNLSTDDLAVLLNFLKPDIDDLSRELGRLSHRADLQGYLNDLYTLDEDGDGWLVVSEAFGPPVFGRSTILNETPRLWNLAAPLFHSRRTIVGKLEQLEQFFSETQEVGLTECLARLHATHDRIRGGEVLDGPMASHTRRPNDYEVEATYGWVAHRRAYYIMTALAIYHLDHGRYPTALAQLVPEYLPGVPLNPLANEPYTYVAQRDGTYHLGSSVDFVRLTRHDLPHRSAAYYFAPTPREQAPDQ